MLLPSRAVRALLVAPVAVLAFAACDDGDDPVNPGLPVPGDLSATALGATRIRLNWTAVTNAASYTVERAGQSGAFASIGTTTQPTYTDSVGLEPNTQYRYRVFATSGTNAGIAAEVNTATAQAGQGGAVNLATVITTNRTLSPDTLYQLNGYTKVLSGATLTIPAGTRVLGGIASTATGNTGGALFVYKGARLVVQGTAANPVVFTSSRPVGQRAAGDWGGIVIVGRATSNRNGTAVLTESPGPVVNETDGSGGTQQAYSQGTDDNDNSGDIRYLRIEFAGFAVSQDNELNALSMYAVGRGTRLEYVQTLNGLDDSFEWFGGTVDGRYLISYESGDDHFDTSEGYRGRNQFLIGYQTWVPTVNPGGSAGGAATDPVFFEADGCQGGGCNNASQFESTPFSMPVFANFTVVGTGPGVLPAANGGFGLVLRRGTGGTWVNGVAARMGNRAITVRDAFTNTQLTRDSLSLRNIFLAENVANFDPDGSTQFGQASKFTNFAIDSAAAGTTASSLFLAVPAVAQAATTTSLDWTPAAGAPAPLRTGGLATFPANIAARMASYFGGTLGGTAYRGAANPDGSNKWWQGWTSYARN
jgi:hypothetical protein